MNWFAPGQPPMASHGDMSELTQAKYLARFFALNNWLGCGAVWWVLYQNSGVYEYCLLRSWDFSPRPAYYSAGYISTILDGAQASDAVKPEISQAEPNDLVIKVYRGGKDEILVGLWRKSPADDFCRPVPVTLKLPGIWVSHADLVDTLYGYRQDAIMQVEKNAAVIPDLLTGDWPLFVRLHKKTIVE